MELKDKVVVVIGGLGLLGNEFCKAISLNGGKALIADIRPSKGAYLVNSLSEDSVNGLIENLVADHGKVDAVVNTVYPKNSEYGKNFLELDYRNFSENTSWHINSFFLISKKFFEFFAKQGFGNIINISSIYGFLSPRFELYQETNMTVPVEYATSKSSIIMLTKYMAKLSKGLNIRVNSISPGGIYDNQPQQFITRYNEKCINKGMLDPSDISGSLIFLLSDSSLFINGQNIVVDDGFSL